MSGVILLHWDADGALHWLATEGVKVVCVDERTPIPFRDLLIDMARSVYAQKAAA